MPKKVDHQQRRELIADALMRVAADRGLEAVSLRHVAAEAGVTAGMVQHYFPSKDAMLAFAMSAASAAFEARIGTAVSALGEDPTPREQTGAILRTLLPTNERERADARVTLAFLSYAATQRAAADGLGQDTGGLRAHLAALVRAAQDEWGSPAGLDPQSAAVGLLALAEGLGVHVLSAGLSVDAARRALESHLDLVFGAPNP